MDHPRALTRGGLLAATLAFATAATGLVGLTATASVAAEPPRPPVAAVTAAAPSGAPIVVGNADDDQFSGIVDILRPGFAKGFASAVDEDDGMAVGDLTGDGIDEVVIADDDETRVDVHDTRPGDTFGDILFSWDSAFNTEEDAIAVGDVTADNPGNEIVVADESLGQLRVYRADGKLVASFLGNTRYDANDDMVVGNVIGGPQEEILIVNSEDDGRVDAFQPDGHILATIHTGFDGNSDDVASGNVMGDDHDEVVVANDEDSSRIESHDVSGHNQADMHDTGYDSDDRIGVGPVNGTGTDEVVVANTEQSGRLDIIDFEGGVTQRDSGFDSDDRFAVGTFGGGDIDGDGIPDRVELDGIRDDDGKLVEGWDLDALGASPCRPDVLVEVDYMDASGAATDPHVHKPDPKAITDVETAFDRAPVDPVVEDCPYAGQITGGGIGLHVVVDDAVDEQDELDGATGFEAAKADGGNFDDALDPYVHYSLWGHELKNDKVDGLADFTADDQDFFLALGSGAGKVGSQDHQASTFMHELGHALGLGHGGGDAVNQKPNYLSVMNYSFAVEGSPEFGVPLANGDRVRDYSSKALDPLNKRTLVEADGIGDTGFSTLWYDDAGTEHTEVATGPLDWDFNGDKTETVKVNINRDNGGLCVEEDPTDGDKKLATSTDGDDVVVTDDGFEDIYGGPDFICDTDARGGDLQSVPVGTEQVLTGFDDWENLDLLHGTPAGSTSLRPPTEMTEAEMAEISAAWDRALRPDQGVLLDAPRPGFRAASLGVAADADHVYALHSYRTIAQPSTSDRRGTLVVLDRKTLAVQDRITVGWGPKAVAVDPVRHLAYVVNLGQDSFSVSVVDLQARQVVGEVPIGQGPVDVAVNVGLNRVYVANTFGQRVEVIDGATRTKLAPVPVGPGVTGLAVDEATDTVYVAMTKRGGGQPEFAALGAFVDNGVTRPQVLPRVDLGDPSVQPVDVAVDPVGRRLYVGGLGAAGAQPPSVSVLDLDTRQLLARLPNRGPVRAVEVDADGRRVVAVGDRGIDIYDPATLSLVRQIDAGIPFSVAVGPGSDRELFAGDFLSGELHRRSYSSGTAVGP